MEDYISFPYLAFTHEPQPETLSPHRAPGAGAAEQVTLEQAALQQQVRNRSSLCTTQSLMDPTVEA